MSFNIQLLNAKIGSFRRGTGTCCLYDGGFHGLRYDSQYLQGLGMNLYENILHTDCSIKLGYSHPPPQS